MEHIDGVFDVGLIPILSIDVMVSCIELICQASHLALYCTVEPRPSEHFSDRRRVADEDDTVLDDAHESSSAASQDRGNDNNNNNCLFNPA